MVPLAKLWTFIGNWFIPLAAGWAVFVRAGLTEQPSEGALISRAYWGLLVTLVVGAVLSWVFALYAKDAVKIHGESLFPPNTSFEDKVDRNLLISRGTFALFATSLLIALVLFASSYSDSVVHQWDAHDGLANGFWASRFEAHRLGCPRGPCFAMASRWAGGTSLFGVHEYILYLTDGALFVLAAVWLSAPVFLINALVRRARPMRRSATPPSA
jgi:hypothetical protein